MTVRRSQLTMSKALFRSTKVEVGSHLLTPLLQLTGGEGHVRGPTMTTEAALAFRPETLSQMFVQAVEENASEDLLGDV
ncbi:hypothetical protein SprV_0200751700 [Sparganum proliferum]